MCALLISFLLSFSPSARADDDSYAADRKQASALVAENKYLEALPILERLLAAKPTDHEVMVNLAGGLISQAVVFDQTDPEAGVKSRVRARQLLVKAKALGNKSPVVDTELEMMREDGRVERSDKPIDVALRTAEAAYARADYPEAIKYYQKMLDLDPKNYAAALYIGDSYQQAKEYDKASDWFDRAITIDPNTATAYRYYASVLTRKGEPARARTKFIQAVVAEPYAALTWRSLNGWVESVGDRLDTSPLSIPEAGKATYAATRAAWKAGRFNKHYPKEKAYRRSLAEEVAALTAAADAAKAAGPANDDNLAVLLKYKESGMLEPYVLLITPDKDIAKDYAAYRKQNRIKLESYLDAFVVPAAPAK